MATMFTQYDPNLERRKALAQAMMEQGRQKSQQPMRHWTQSADSLLSSLLGAYNDKKVTNEQTAKDKAFNDSVQTAMAGGDYGQLASVLSGNQNTADIGIKMQMDRLAQEQAEKQRQQQRQETITREDKLISDENAEWRSRQEFMRGQNQPSQQPGQISKSLQEKMMFEDYKNTLQNERDQTKLDREQTQADRETLMALNRGKQVLTNENFRGAVGPVDQWTGGVGGWFGTDDGRARGDAERFIAEEVLDASGKLKGAISEAEWPRLESTRPELGDHPSIWVDWYMNVLDATEINNPHLANDIAALRNDVLLSADQQFNYRKQRKSPSASDAVTGGDPLGLGFGNTD